MGKKNIMGAAITAATFLGFLLIPVLLVVVPVACGIAAMALTGSWVAVFVAGLAPYLFAWWVLTKV